MNNSSRSIGGAECVGMPPRSLRNGMFSQNGWVLGGQHHRFTVPLPRNEELPGLTVSVSYKCPIAVRYCNDGLCDCWDTVRMWILPHIRPPNEMLSARSCGYWHALWLSWWSLELHCFA